MGKLNSSKKYLLVADYTLPDEDPSLPGPLRGLRFYDSGFKENNIPIYYSENLLFTLRVQMGRPPRPGGQVAYQWSIFSPSVVIAYKSGSIDPIGNYSNNYKILSYRTNKNISINKQNLGGGKLNLN